MIGPARGRRALYLRVVCRGLRKAVVPLGHLAQAEVGRRLAWVRHHCVLSIRGFLQGDRIIARGQPKISDHFVSY
jgi:hypothetical protein